MTSKERNSNIELCRIYSMLLIILLHSTWASIGYPSLIGPKSIFVILVYAISIIGVNTFLFISGWFSIKLKKSSVINLLWICLFYGVIRVALKIFLGELEWDSFLFISKSNWFVVSYIGLLLFSPILNKGVEYASKWELGGGDFVVAHL